MNTIDLPQFTIEPKFGISHEFLKRGIEDLHAAVEYIRNLPYGRISDPSNCALVLIEERGTCSNKHATIAQLAQEQEWPDIHLTVGMYEMNGENTPKISKVLDKYAITSIPEAHCYISYYDKRIDFTHSNSNGEPQISIQSETIITPRQSGSCKKDIHQKWMKKWMKKNGIKIEFDQLWKIREECIRTLSKK